jgi:polyhydroxyalkanoate synthesis regulator phasin
MSKFYGYFYGNKVSDYGIENGRVDYATLAKSFDAVLNNDIMNKTSDIGYWEQVNGFVDHSDEIEELQDKIDELETVRDDAYGHAETNEINALCEQIDALYEQIGELQEEQDDEPEIFQYYIISDEGADILKRETNEIIYYNEELDMYVWGVTHWGTSWDYVLTDIALEEVKDN